MLRCGGAREASLSQGRLSDQPDVEAAACA